MLREKMLRLLLWAMSQPRTFYVLGAGASYGLIPITRELRRIIEAEYLSVGVFPFELAPPSLLFERLIGNISPYGNDLRTAILARMPPGALDLMAQRALWSPKSDVVPPQYAVFDIIPPATLFNFNLDGLAAEYCAHRHIVLEPHGRIDVPWLAHGVYHELLEATVVYGARIPHITAKLLPAPEPEGIVQGSIYVRARELIRHARVVVFIGYSFGQRDATFDDAESLRFFGTQLREQACPVLVVSPTPNELVEHLRDRLSTYNVHGIALRWELLSGLLMVSANHMAGISASWSDGQLQELTREYQRALDTNKNA